MEGGGGVAPVNVLRRGKEQNEGERREINLQKHQPVYKLCSSHFIFQNINVSSNQAAFSFFTPEFVQLLQKSLR